MKCEQGMSPLAPSFCCWPCKFSAYL